MIKVSISFYLALIASTTFSNAMATAAPVNQEQSEQHIAPTTNENAPGAVMFIPPQGWRYAETKDLPRSVQVMVVGKGAGNFPPSINLATEKYAGTLKQYLKIVKSINDAKGSEWKDLGTIRTEAGDASLSQVDQKNQWGVTRMMHVMLIKNGTVYILTAAALKDEFPVYYKDFFNSLRSLRINKNLYEMVSNAKKRTELLTAADNVKIAWKSAYAARKKSLGNTEPDVLAEEVFKSDDFQSKQWIPFKEMLSKDYSEMGDDWNKQLLNQLHEELGAS